MKREANNENEFEKEKNENILFLQNKIGVFFIYTFLKFIFHYFCFIYLLI